MLTILALLVAALFAQNTNTPAYPTTSATDATLSVAARLSESTLATSINSSTLTVVVSSGSSFLNHQIIRIDNEEMQICSKASNTLTICSGARGFNGTTAAAHTAGVAVRGIITSWHHNQVAAEIKAMSGALVPIPFSNFPGTCVASKQLALRSDPSAAGQVLYICNSAGNGFNLVGDGATGVASSITSTPAGSLSSSNVQDALNELDTEKAASSHTHAATAVTNTATGGISSTTVQAAINELDTEKAATSHAHAANTVTSTPAGSLSASNVQDALNELDTEKMGLKQAITLTGDVTIDSSHCGGYLAWTGGTSPVATIPAPGTLTSGCFFHFSVYAASSVSLTASSSSINGISSVVVLRGSAGVVANNGTGWFTFTTPVPVTTSAMSVGYNPASGTFDLYPLNVRASTANASSTGTTLYHLAKLNGSGQAVIVGTSDTSGAIGIVVSGAGTSGTANMQQQGMGLLYPASSATAGQYVGISSSTAGRGSSSSTCPTGQNIGVWAESGDNSTARAILLGNFCDQNSGSSGISVKLDGVAVGTRTHLNILTGTNITPITSDDAGNDEVEISFSLAPASEIVVTPTIELAGCNGSTASMAVNTWTSNAATPVCLAGSNQTEGAAQFANSGTQEIRPMLLLPDTYVSGATVTLRVVFSSPTNTGNFKLFAETAFVASGGNPDPSFGSPASTTCAVAGTINYDTHCTLTLNMVNEGANKRMHLRIYRLAGSDSGDTAEDVVNMKSISLKMRRTIQ